MQHEPHLIKQVVYSEWFRQDHVNSGLLCELSLFETNICSCEDHRQMSSNLPGGFQFADPSAAVQTIEYGHLPVKNNGFDFYLLVNIQ